MNSLGNLESWSEALSESPSGSVLAKDLNLWVFNHVWGMGCL